MNIPEFIPENLRQARLLLKLSQTELAALAGMSQKDISLHESKTSKRLIPVRYILALVSKGVDLNSLFREGAVRLLTRDEQLESPMLRKLEKATRVERQLSAAAEPQAPYGMQAIIEDMQRRLDELEKKQR